MSNDANSSQVRDDSASSWALLRLLCQLFAQSVEPILHTGIGERYLGPRSLLVIPLIMLFTVFWPHENPWPMTIFLGIWLLGAFSNRVARVRARFRGEMPAHSYYNGTPRLSRFIPRVSERLMKRFVEPTLVALAALTVGVWNKPLSVYLWCSAASLVMTLAMYDLSQRQRSQDAYDAMIEQRIFRERFDRLNRNRR